MGVTVRPGTVVRGTAFGFLGLLVVAEALDTGSVPGTVGFLVCGLLAAAVALRPGARPIQVAVAAGASALFSIVCAGMAVRPEHTFGMAELVALSWMVVTSTRRHRALSAVALSGALTVATGLLPLRLNGQTDLFTKGTMGMAMALGQIFAVLLGVCLRLYDRLRAREREQILQAQRLAYARDLHDLVAHHVTAIVAQTRAVRFVTATGRPPQPEDLDGMLARIEQAGSEALESMRGVVAMLRNGEDVPSSRSQPTLAQVVSEAVAAVTGTGLHPDLTLDERLAGRQLPAPIVDAARHVVREALTNVLRHAGEVTRVEVRARVCPDDPHLVQITVTDDGHAAATPLPRGGYGLAGLTERVAAVGGRLTAGRHEQGWRVTALLPMTAVPTLPSSRP